MLHYLRSPYRNVSTTALVFVITLLLLFCPFLIVALPHWLSLLTSFSDHNIFCLLRFWQANSLRIIRIVVIEQSRRFHSCILLHSQQAANLLWQMNGCTKVSLGEMRWEIRKWQGNRKRKTESWWVLRRKAVNGGDGMSNCTLCGWYSLEREKN